MLIGTVATNSRGFIFSILKNCGVSLIFIVDSHYKIPTSKYETSASARVLRNVVVFMSLDSHINIKISVA